jgi:hypothetical protein
MNREVDLIGLCGLYCGKCALSVSGEIRNASQILRSHLRGFEMYAEKMSEKFPVLCGYQGFLRVLNWFAAQECPGCRQGGGVRGCSIRNCCEEEGHEFCYRCDRFPCGEIHGQMITNSNMIKKIGVEAFVTGEKSKIGFV